MEKKLDSNYTRMLRASPGTILNKSWRHHPTKKQLYGYLPTHHENYQSQTNQTCETLLEKDELISDILLWTPSHRRAKAGRSARSYIQELCPDSGFNLEGLPGAMDDRDGWRERVRENHAGSVT